jgi:hypothetical protein
VKRLDRAAVTGRTPTRARLRLIALAAFMVAAIAAMALLRELQWL